MVRKLRKPLSGHSSKARPLELPENKRTFQEAGVAQLVEQRFRKPKKGKKKGRKKIDENPKTT